MVDAGRTTSLSLLSLSNCLKLSADVLQRLGLHDYSLCDPGYLVQCTPEYIMYDSDMDFWIQETNFFTFL